MAIVALFTYEWPSYMCSSEVGLDSETGQAYDLMYVLVHGYGGAYGTKLERKVPITYDEVRRKAQIAYDTGLANHTAFIVNPSAYGSLSEDSWRVFVKNPPALNLNPSVYHGLT